MASFFYTEGASGRSMLSGMVEWMVMGYVQIVMSLSWHHVRHRHGGLKGIFLCYTVLYFIFLKQEHKM